MDNKYFFRLGNGKFMLLDVNGEKNSITREFSDTKRLVELHNENSPVASIYENNIKVGKYVKLGNRIDGAAVVAAKSFCNK